MQWSVRMGADTHGHRGKLFANAAYRFGGVTEKAATKAYIRTYGYKAYLQSQIRQIQMQ